MSKQKKNTRKTTQEPIAKCDCCEHLFYIKSSDHPNGLKKGLNSLQSVRNAAVKT